MNRRFSAAATAAAVVTVMAAPSILHADPVADFYKGRTITMVVGFPAGGMYGINGRIMSRHFGKQIPGKPTIIVQHMPGNGGNKAANYMYNAAPKDGSMIAELSKDVAVTQLLRPKSAKYDATKFNFIGRMQPYSAVLMVWHKAGVNTVEDAKNKTMIIGSSGKSSHDYTEAALLRHFAGFKIKSVVGYRGAAGMYKAMESSEIHGRIGAWNSLKAARPHWLKDKLVSIVVQTGLKKQPDLPDVPLMIDLMPNDDARKMAEITSIGSPVGWGLSAPPGVPPDRVTALRRAFDRMVADPDFLAEIKQRNVGGETATGEEVQAIVARTLETSPEIIKKMQKIAGH